MKEVFVVIAVTREDVRFALGPPADTWEFSDATMEAIADRMSEACRAYRGISYWDVVAEAAEAVLEEK